MSANNFKSFLSHCSNFVLKMNKNHLSKNVQKVMLKAYIAGYVANNKLKIRLADSHITELVG